MKDLMIDLETLGSDYGSVITQIGACYFDRDGNIGDTFLVNIDPKDACREGFKIEYGAVEFWFGRKTKTWMLDPKLKLREAFEKYREFSKKAKCVWSHATFDFSMMLDACFRMGIKPVNHYSDTKDIRTLMEIAKHLGSDCYHRDDEYPEDAHDALADCKRQVGYCVKAFKVIEHGVVQPTQREIKGGGK